MQTDPNNTFFNAAAGPENMYLGIYLVSEKGDENGGVEYDPKNGDRGVEDDKDVVGGGGQPEIDGRKKLTHSHK